MVENVYGTTHILKHLEKCISEKKPFSVIRLGEGTYGIFDSVYDLKILDGGPWAGDLGKTNTRRNIGDRLGIPKTEWKRILRYVVNAANQADYVDSYKALDLIPVEHPWFKDFGLREVDSKSDQIQRKVGIENHNCCNPYLAYYACLKNEYNLFDILKNRKIFCITDEVRILPVLLKKSGAQSIEGYKVPGRGTGKSWNHFEKVLEMCPDLAQSYDLTLIGAGLLGKLYGAKIRRFGGRVFDVGRVFSIWGGTRGIPRKPLFLPESLNYHGGDLLFKRRRLGTNAKIW